jgi:predicted unusual protein kinase regulating ubiquinone biosynthesis (AarF/ABC1/UbiB family)
LGFLYVPNAYSEKVHADPHPGNFLISENKELLVIDFGCIKEIPEDFYIPYFELAKEENLKNPEFSVKNYSRLKFSVKKIHHRKKNFLPNFLRIAGIVYKTFLIRKNSIFQTNLSFRKLPISDNDMLKSAI